MKKLKQAMQKLGGNYKLMLFSDGSGDITARDFDGEKFETNTVAEFENWDEFKAARNAILTDM